MNQKGRYGRYISSLLSIADLAVVNLLFWLTTVLCPALSAPGLKFVWLLLNVAYLPVTYWFAYVNRRRAMYMEHVVLCALQAVFIHALFFISLIAFLKLQYFPIRVYVVFYCMMLVGLPGWWAVSRWFVKRMRRYGYNFVKVVIVGTNPTALRLLDELRSDAGFGYRIMGFFDEKEPYKFAETYLGDIDSLGAYIRANDVHEVYYCLSGENIAALSAVTKATDDNVVKFFYVPQMSPYLTRNFEMYNIGTMPVMTLRPNPLSLPVNRWMKRGFDVVFSSAFLLVSPIIFIPIAIAIKCSSPGPIFFRQERTGYRGRSFKCLKFRTMRVNADADTRQATADDPRKTRLGDFLRRTSLDELPQFINVWLGDMSVVGPRPHMLRHTEQYSQIIDKYMVRHVVKPGITGWAQVHGFRGITDQVWKMEKRVVYDVQYVENWTFLMDMKIIVRTITNALHKDENAF